MSQLGSSAANPGWATSSSSASSPPRARKSSLLPIPARQATLNRKASPTGVQPTALSTLDKAKSIKNYDTSNIARTISPSAKPSSNRAKITIISDRPSSTAPTSAIPNINSLSTSISSSRNKAAVNRAASALEQRGDKATGQAANLSNATNINHSLRKMPRILGHTINRQDKILTSSASSPLNARPPGIRRPAISNASSFAPPRSSFTRQAPPAYQGTTIPYQPRKVRSQQEITKQLIELAPSTNILETPNQSNGDSRKKVTSPESLRSNITSTDGGDSIRTKVDYRHPPIHTTKLFPKAFGPLANNPPNLAGRLTDIHLTPSDTQHQSPPVFSRPTEPSEVQSRLFILEKLQTLISIGGCQTLVDLDAIYRLIRQADWYETQQDIQERFLRNAFLTPVQGQSGLTHAPLALEFATRSSPLIPQATLEAPVNQTPASSHTLIPRSSPLLPVTEPMLSAPGSGLKKSHHVGNMLLGKLGWRSKTQSNQANKSSSAKLLNKSLRPSSFVLNSNFNKGKILNQIASVEKPSQPDPFRSTTFEIADGSVCAVILGERLHVLPLLPFCVIEEIYRRGMRTAGIFRISGDLDRIDILMKFFESHAQSGAEDLSSEDIHTLCGLLKHYLRSLPEPVFHPLLGELFWTLCVEPEYTKCSDDTQDSCSPQLLMAQYIIQLLPTRSLSLLAYLIPFLAQIPTFIENRIQHDSLATMLGPAIFVCREIGLPGLGLYPRPAKANCTMNTPGGSWPPSPLSFSSASCELDKNELSRRATECTLWMMNHWKQLFGVIYVPEDSQLQARHTLETKHSNKPSAPTPLPAFLPNAGTTPSNEPTARLLDFPSSGQLQRQSPTYSSTFSILTYSSDVSESQESVALQQSPPISPPTSLYSHPASKTSAHLRPDAGESENSTGPVRNSFHEPRAGLGLDYIGKDLNRKNSQKESEDNKLKQQTNLTKTYSKPAEMAENIRSLSPKNVVGLLTEYIGERNSRISQQESLIESLVEEIGRLRTSEEKASKERGIVSKETKVGSDMARNLIDGQSHKVDNSSDSPCANINGAVKSNVASPSETLLPPTSEDNSEYIDYHNQMFNYSNTDGHKNVDTAESSSQVMETPSMGDLTSDSILSTSTSSRTPSLDEKNNQYFDYHQQMFNYRSDETNGEAIEQLKLMKLPAEDTGTSGDEVQGTITRRLRRANKDLNLTHASLTNASETRSKGDLNDLDNKSDQSHTESLELEISRLKLVNSHLLRKLRSIESIINEGF